MKTPHTHFRCSIMECTKAKRANSSRIVFSWHLIPCERFYSEIRKQWINIIRKSRRDRNWVPTKGSRLCCIHFEPACFKYDSTGQKMMLSKVSIPTLFLGGDDSQGNGNAAIDSTFQIFQSEFDPLDIQAPKDDIHCSVSDCANSSEVSVPWRIFHKFPAPCLDDHYVKERSTNTRLQKWIEFAKRKDVNGKPWHPTPYSYICNEHFVRNCISDDPESPSYLPTIRTFHRNMTCISCNEKYTKVLPSDSDNSEHLILKMFVCKILKLDMKLIQVDGPIPFCSSCEEKIKYLQESHNELEALKNKIEKLETQLLKDIISTYIIRNNLTESGNHINEGILQKWNAYELHRKWYRQTSYKATRNNVPFIGDEDDIDIVNDERSGRDNDNEDNKSESDDYAQEKFSCSFCGESFETADNLKDHESTHPANSKKKRKKTVICGECGKLCPNSSKLKRHLLIHTKEKPFSCSQCEMAFASKQQLKIHVMQVHTGERPFECSICDKGFTTSTMLKSHSLTHSEERPYTCKTCGQMFKTSRSLKIHEVIHNIEKLYKCSICNKGFNYSTNLKQHLAFHQKPPNEKLDPFHQKSPEVNLGPPFKCSLCEKSFAQNWKLVGHMRVHTGEKPYACPICDKKFAFSKNLRRHSKTHTGERPFGCSVCEKSFFQQNVLKQHMNIHTGEKPYLCSICGQRFSQSSTLVEHLKTHSETRSYSCTICGEMFRNSVSLKKHEQIHDTMTP